MTAEKQDANLVGFYKIRESVLGTTPATGAWATREPNSFDDLGAEYSKTARRPFSPSRQRKKGSTTDLDADGGYNEDLTQNNMQSEFEEFFFAALHETNAKAVSAVSGTQYTIPASHGFLAGDLVLASGHSTAGNNGLKEITAVGATTATAAGLTIEGSPPAAAQLKHVGFAFATSDAVLNATTANVLITTTTKDLTQLGLEPGQWIFYNQGDTTNIGYGRVAAVAANQLTLDKTTWTAVDAAGTGNDAMIYFGDFVRNEADPDDIVRFSATMERTLGRDDDGVQSEYLTGAVANEMKWNSPLTGLVNIDMSYIAQRAGTRTGAQGPLSARASNTRTAAGNEDAFNTSSDVYRLRLAMVDPTTLNPTPYFARVTEWNGSIKNNVSGAKAQGVLGSFDAIVGNFDVDIELTAYFTTVEAIHAVKCNHNATFDAIYAKANAGVYIDVPLLSLGGGRLNIEQDAAIMLPLNSPAAESDFGHTALIGWFNYLPDEAMPDADC